MKVTILGCGGSGGVPLIGCRCAVCTSTDPRNKRTRVSIVVEDGDTRILVDAAPDLRQQFLANGLSRVDAVILTHSHADHLHGIDDLRSVNFHRNAPLDVWADANTLVEAQRRFGYAFNPPRHVDGIWYAPSLQPRELTGPLITELANAGDPVAAGAIETIGRALGVGVANLVNIFNPQVVVIGGGVIAAGELLLAPAREVMMERALSPGKDSVRVEAARYGPEAGMIGAALFAREVADGRPTGAIEGRPS